jgi:hypothetical protein
MRSVAFKLAVPALVAVALTLALAHRGGDFAGYVLVGELGLAGRDLWGAGSPNTWPPLFALLCIPLALLARISLVGARVLWLILNWAALACAVAAAVRLVYGRGLSASRSPTTTRDGIDIGSGAVLLPVLLSVCWILSNFEHLQVNIVILALTLVGLTLHQRGSDTRAGLMIGAAAALKVMPVLFVPYFLWRRQWRAALSTGAFAIAWSLVPAVAYGWPAYVGQLEAWRGVLRTGWGVGKMNLSVYAMFDRLLGHGLVPFTVPGSDALRASGSGTVTVAVAGLLALVTWLGLRLFRGPYDPRHRATVAEWSTVLLVASLFGTVTWKAYLVVLLLPMTLFVATWRDDDTDPAFRRRLRALTWLAFLPGLATASDLAGRSLAWRLEMGSILTFMGLLILGLLFWYRARVSPTIVLATTTP